MKTGESHSDWATDCIVHEYLLRPHKGGILGDGKERRGERIFFAHVELDIHPERELASRGRLAYSG